MTKYLQMEGNYIGGKISYANNFVSICNGGYYTHKIFDLCNIANMNGVKVPKEIWMNAQMYTDWEAAGRYDLHFSVRIDSIEKAVTLAQKWINDLKVS